VEGIDRIKSHILDQAEAEAEAIAAETEVFVDREHANAQRSCEKILAEAEEQADQEAELLIKRGQSLADALRRRQELERKQELADRVIQRALELLREKPAPERVGLYAGLIRAGGLKEGVITLSAADRAEIGQALLKALPEGRFTLDEEDGAFSGGVVVTQGRIRDNLTYDTVVRDFRPELARAALEFPGMDGGDGADG
jgi:vacuolar-type H+-ATPase subunit E/Vma4